MTIAACYRSPEGIVLGADSTASYGSHYYNHTQKLFEVGEQGTMGMVTWGIGGFGSVSYRTLIARLGDGISAQPPKDLTEVANRWIEMVWAEYESGELAPLLEQCKKLHAKGPFDAAAVGAALTRTKDEEEQYKNLSRDLVVGFCVAGYVLPGPRVPEAFQMVLDPLKPKPNVEPVGDPKRPFEYGFWGVPNMIQRLIHGIDASLAEQILHSGKWSGTRDDFNAIVAQHVLSHPIIPIREAVDFVHACLCSTIKAIKFSNLSQTCGGHVEVAVITSDRKFRWVCHKGWDTAITEGQK